MYYYKKIVYNEKLQKSMYELILLTFYINA